MESRKIVELPEATIDMLSRCIEKLKPPPELTLSQWADRYRVLSQESSAEPGKWHTDKAPYQRAIMDAIGDPHTRRVVIMCAAQLGKTELLLNILGYYMAYSPAPILVMQPTLDMGQTFSKDRLAPMLRDTPALRGLVDVKSRYSGNTIMKKNFPGGHVTIVGANSATGLASRPIKVLLADEVDRYPGSAGTEGDPLSLAQKRQTTFWDKKTIMVSTPVIKGQSRIETEYNQSTKEEWNIPCPVCKHYQPLVWANIIFDSSNPDKAPLYKCEKCGAESGEYEWKAQEKYGMYVAENTEAETRGFHLNTLASTFCGWKEVVQKFLVAKEQMDQGNPEGMKVWVNTELGETWEERGETVEGEELYNRREIYGAEVPDGVIVLTAGVDVQDDRFEVEVVGWGVGKESWGIRYQKIYGDMLKEQVWEDLDNFLMSGFQKKDGTTLHILATCMDSGGHHTDQVYRFTKARFERRVWAIKGKGGAETPYIRNPSTNNRVKTPLFIIGVDAGKTLLYQRLRHGTKGPNYCHFPEDEAAGYDQAYFHGLTSEKMVVRFRKGRSVTVWEIKDSSHKRNEPLDLRNYATAALEIANPVLNTAEPGKNKAAKRTGRRKISGGI
jgi:phage terminase large subunit GpA-like protein